MATGGVPDVLDQLRARLNQLHRENGEPSSREISQRTRKAISHTTVLQVVRCARTPTWAQLELVVEALGGDSTEFRTLWVAVRNAEQPVGAAGHHKRDMLVDVARRNQAMVGELTDYVRYMQRGEADPERREALLTLERIATRMRRQNENVLLLEGEEPRGSHREPMTLVDVLRSAQAELGVQQRVDVGRVDRGAGIIPPAVRGIVRLVAELLDNALEFSPPQSPVVVTTDLNDAALVLHVDDNGIGIPTAVIADFAERLEDVSQLSRPFRTMGLTVVAHLAARLGIQVELRRRDPSGTRATVTVPTALVVRVTPPVPEHHSRVPDQSHRAMFASMPREDLRKLIDLLPTDQVRLVLAGLAADGARAVLDETRSPGWPATYAPPVRRTRPGLGSES